MNHHKKNRYFTIIAIAICVLLVTHLWFKQPVGLLEKYSSYVIYPLLRIQHCIVDPISQWLSKKQTIAEQSAMINNLVNERDDLLAEAIELRSKLYYIEQMKEINDDNKNLAELTVCKAQIIVKSFSDHGHYFFIDAGTNQGIKPDMIVVYKQSLLGKVTQVYPWYSKVIAITDESCKVAACCVNSKTTGIHEGSNKLECTQLQFVSHLEKIEPGDHIISSGKGLVFPQGLSLGQVVSCTKNDLYYVIDVKPSADLLKIDYCTVLDRSKTVLFCQNV